MRQQLNLDQAQSLVDELGRIADHDPTREATRWMSETIQAVIDEVNMTRRERDGARNVILKAGELVVKWTETYNGYDDHTGTTNLGYGYAATELNDTLTPELERD